MSEQKVTTLPSTERRAVPPSPSGEEVLRRRLLAALWAPVETHKLTYDEFLDWADEDTLAEWVNGEVVMATPASKRHQDIVGFLASVMRIFAEHHDLGVVLSAPFQMKLSQSGREPDLLFVAREHLERLQETHLEGPADLVLEAISPENVGRDRGEKFYEYAQGGVSEYWLLDPQTRWAEFYQLEGDHYHQAFAGQEGKYQSRVLAGFWLRVERLWQSPLPPVLEVLHEMALI